MTQDEIIVWAKEFGLQVKPPSWGYSDTHTIGNIYVEHLVAFAKLVAEAEREACAKLVEPDEEHRRDASWGYLGGAEGVELLDAKVAAIRARGQA